MGLLELTMSRVPNRLAHSTSPYLLQHASNPVDWHPWGAEALDKAKREDKPIFLSVGYSACHWCHVMERESFEDEQVAGFLNAHFVPVKVDREERPDLDELYMGAVLAVTGRGGWPLSVWLTPDLEPFYGGTYFPPTAQPGAPGFLGVLIRIAQLWDENRADLLRDAHGLAHELAQAAKVEAGDRLPDAQVFPRALTLLRNTFDARWGGFGPAPKFPAHTALELILRHGEARDWGMATRTLDGMWEGGLYDHVGGGFARYSVDQRWLIPHFEKMLYDNAQLASCYLKAFQRNGAPRYAQVARETLDYLLRDMQDREGGFYSSEDADSEGVEGRFYAFRRAEVLEALGVEDGALFCGVFGVTEEGNFEGANVLHRVSGESLSEERLLELRRKLRDYRARRVRPGKDDKVLAAWNGLALSALALGAQVLGDPRYVEAGERCANFLQRELWQSGALVRVWRGGRAHTSAFLEDYGALAVGLVDLYETSFDTRWLRWAEALGAALLQKFEDPVEGGFFTTEADQRDLLFRQKAFLDGAVPPGNAMAVEALLRLSWHLDRSDFQEAARRALRCAAPLLEKAPRHCLSLLAVLSVALSGPVEIVMTGVREDPRLSALLEVVWKEFLPARVLSLVSSDEVLPLHRGRASGGAPLAYLCHGQTCLAPCAEPEHLATCLADLVKMQN